MPKLGHKIKMIEAVVAICHAFNQIFRKLTLYKSNLSIINEQEKSVSKLENEDQESIQSSTTPDPEHHMGK